MQYFDCIYLICILLWLFEFGHVKEKNFFVIAAVYLRALLSNYWVELPSLAWTTNN